MKFLLNKAIINGNLKIARLLISRGYTLNHEDSISIFRNALQVGNYTIVKFLLDLGEKLVRNQNSHKLEIEYSELINSQITLGYKVALHHAIANGLCDVVKLLLDHGADLRIKSFGRTPLEVAAKNNDLPIINILIDYGAGAEQVASAFKLLIHPMNIVRPQSIKRISTIQNSIPHGADLYVCLSIRFNQIIERQEELISTQRWYRYKECLQVIGKLMMKNIVAGLKVDEEVLEELRKNLEYDLCALSMSFDFRLFMYEAKLEREVSMMKNCRLWKSLSLYHIFTTKNPRYRSNKSLMRRLNLFHYDEFPEYEELIKRKINLDKKRFDILPQAVRCFNLLVQHRNQETNSLLPEDLIERIIIHLDIADLQSLIRSVRGSNIPNQIEA